VVGDGRPHLAALIVLEPTDPAGDMEEEARATVATAIAEVNASLDPRERIGAHAIVADAWLPGAELTETLKLRRVPIAERYEETVDGFYSSSTI
jgi:long-chain acyl-CoA synthetase